MGKAICKEILRVYPESYVLLGSRDQQRGIEAVQDIISELGESFASHIEPIQLDVTKDESVTEAARIIKEKFGEHSLYGLINNAGIADATVGEIMDVNLYGVKRVCASFVPDMLNVSEGRVVNVSSGSAPKFVENHITEEEKPFFDTNTEASWEQLDEKVKMYIRSIGGADGIASMDTYGFSKACLNVYTIILANKYPSILINSLTPGFIDTDLVRGMVSKRLSMFWVPPFVSSWLADLSKSFLGTKTPEEGTKSSMHCLFGDANQVGSGRYYGSDALRSPITAHREPGSPAYEPV